MHRPYVIACLAASLVVYGAFMVPWVSIMLLAVLLLPVTLGSVKSRWAVGLYIPAVLLVQLFKFEDAPDPLLWISFAGFWVGMAALLRWLGAHHFCITMYTLSGLSYFFGRMAGAEFSATSTGFPYLLAANIFAIIAILYAGWRGGIPSFTNMGAHLRVFRMADGSFLSHRNSVAYLSGIKKEAPKVKEGL